ncbi:acyl-CoA thioesterase [Novosphingobium mangrovi (ex Huang et al. 2023)]|uniref:Acyl-CoA thioesterase n=1 Tax=Novosphingobium mangrovi (ex Huang et al. 2023) TaxID=2976432 RepID=A0ABT2I931_9SPHN|nr:acyl-CoA thioesterase [Novosphingobium mangrovi (ex Huang et al. 2023)]MCT2401286.1 acyl-CoA thioesterase [Novosphingobium mangrovi (ex Huang et al. 2023)]
MAKPDPALLDPARYPFTCTTEPRFGDLDVNMHINNVAMACLLEDARVRFHRACGYRDLLVGKASMVASVAIEYIGEASYPECVQIACAMEHIGRTSHRLVQVVTQGGKPLVFARTVLVTVDPEGPSPLPDTFAASTTAWMLRP